MKILVVGMAVFICLILTILQVIKFCKNSRYKKNLVAAKIKSRKFLFLKGEKSRLISNIVCQVENNAPKFFESQIDYQKLKNSGLFEDKPIFKMFVNNLDLKNKKMIFILNSICKKLSFTPILLCREEKLSDDISKKYKNIKCLNVNDLSPQIIFELNKIDINYISKIEEITEGVYVNGEKADNYRYKNLRLESKRVLKFCDVECYQILDFENAKTIFQKLCFNATQIINIKNSTPKAQKYNITINIKLDNEFVNVDKIGNKLSVKKLDNRVQNFYFSSNNFNFCIKKYQKSVFLSVIFANCKINSGSYSIMSISTFDKKMKSIKLMLLENYCKINKFFALKFNCENERINKLINENLKEIYLKHYFNLRKLNNYKFDNLTTVKQIEKMVASKFNSFEFATFMINTFLGIKQLGSCFQISPRSDINYFSFELELNNKKYQIEYKQNKQKYISYGGLEFVNLDNVNLDFISENCITFCG